MVSISDLKPHNRIEAKEPVYKKKIPCEIVSIEGENLIVNSDGVQFDINVNDVIPIVVTQELLKENGFKFGTFNEAIIITEDGQFSLPTKPGILGWFQDKSLEKKCEYLHQLQNVYEKETGTNLKLIPLPPYPHEKDCDILG